MTDMIGLNLQEAKALHAKYIIFIQGHVLWDKIVIKMKRLETSKIRIMITSRMWKGNGLGWSTKDIVWLFQ